MRLDIVDNNHLNMSYHGSSLSCQLQPLAEWKHRVLKLINTLIGCIWKIDYGIGIRVNADADKAQKIYLHEGVVRNWLRTHQAHTLAGIDSEEKLRRAVLKSALTNLLTTDATTSSKEDDQVDQVLSNDGVADKSNETPPLSHLDNHRPIRNGGNTCYFNTALQVLAHIPFLYDLSNPAKNPLQKLDVESDYQFAERCAAQNVAHELLDEIRNQDGACDDTAAVAFDKINLLHGHLSQTPWRTFWFGPLHSPDDATKVLTGMLLCFGYTHATSLASCPKWRPENGDDFASLFENSSSSGTRQSATMQQIVPQQADTSIHAPPATVTASNGVTYRLTAVQINPGGHWKTLLLDEDCCCLLDDASKNMMSRDEALTRHTHRAGHKYTYFYTAVEA